MKEEAAAGQRDLFFLDQCGCALTLPNNYTWAREGVRPIVPYEASCGQRVNIIGALAPLGPQPALVYASRTTKLDSPLFLDFVCRNVAGLPSALDTLPADYRRARPCTIVLDNYSVHHSQVVKAALPHLEATGVTLFYLPPYSPELNDIEPLWRHLKYEELRVRSYKTATALKEAVDAALAKCAAQIAHYTMKLPRAA